MLCAAAMAVPVLFTACGDSEGEDTVDYVSQVKLDFTSETKKQEVTVRLYVDGDTTHFDPVANSKLPGCNNSADFYAESSPTKGYAKARYLAINTPESTGQIEPYGKKASRFTRSKLESAKSIIIESDDDKWNIDSTGSRYILWIWYMPEGGSEYRNLNIEILQEGYAFDSSASENRYGTYAYGAVTQAQNQQLIVFSGEPDDEYYYGGPINVDLKELRFNASSYEGIKIAVEGTVVADFNNSVYIEDKFYDVEGYEEEGITIGMPVYYSYTTGKVLDILSVGNKVNVVGVVQFYETGGFYQITDIKAYDRYNPDNPNNCKLIEEVGLDKAFNELSAKDFVSTTDKISLEVNKKTEDGETVPTVVTKTYSEALLSTSVSFNDLTVYKIYTTTNEESSSKGAMTLYCRASDGSELMVRTEVLKDSSGNLITESAYLNKVINVKGIVELFNGKYQIKCHRADYITVVE